MGLFDGMKRRKAEKLYEEGMSQLSFFPQKAITNFREAAEWYQKLSPKKKREADESRARLAGLNR